MAEKDTTIPVRVRKELSKDLENISQEIGVKKSDFIRFILEAAVKMNITELKSSFYEFFKTHLYSSIRNIDK